MEKYAKYFKGNEILPIPELVEKLTPRILSLVVSDLKTKRLVGLKKDVRGAVEEGGHPMPVLLSQEFCDVGCPPSYGRTGRQVGG